MVKFSIGAAPAIKVKHFQSKWFLTWSIPSTCFDWKTNTQIDSWSFHYLRSQIWLLLLLLKIQDQTQTWLICPFPVPISNNNFNGQVASTSKDLVPAFTSDEEKHFQRHYENYFDIVDPQIVSRNYHHLKDYHWLLFSLEVYSQTLGLMNLV